MTLAETFDQLDWTIIESYVALKQEEHLHLDFKTLKNAELTSGDDRRNIARCISGFANSSSGIIIWGIDARKNDDGIDCASAIVELRKPALLVSRLNTLSGDATSPIIEKVFDTDQLSIQRAAAGWLPPSYLTLMVDRIWQSSESSGTSSAVVIAFTKWSTLI
jgi:predicted HTH transcriptional regulator